MKKSVAAVSCSVALLLTACGGDSSGSGDDSTTPATATTSTAAPTPTSLTATSISSSSAPTTVATVPETTKATTPPKHTTEPTVESTDNTGSTGSTGPDSTGTPVSGGEYAPVASPVVPSSTKVVPAGGSLADGVYYASVSEAGDPKPAVGSVMFEVVQLFTGPACMAHFGAGDEDACVNDYGVETDPTASVEVALDDQFISVVDAATQQSYRISGAELYDLLLGDVPSAGAPADYLYSGFGFLVTYRAGDITRLEQWWTP